jgi:DNA-binding response OmpR family regulator
MAKILIVEHEAMTAFRLKRYLEKFGYSIVASVHNYKDAMTAVYKNRPDLIICDIEIDEDNTGLQIAQDAEDKFGVGSLLLSEKYSDEMIEEAQKIHFYGFIMKPYREEELLATLKLALHQIEQKRINAIRFVDIGSYTFDKKKKKLYNAEDEISLSIKVTKLIDYLTSNLNEIKSYAEILNDVYEDDEVSLDTLRHLIKRTKTILGKESIVASRNIGYSLRGRVVK